MLPFAPPLCAAAPPPPPLPAVHVERARDLLGTDLAALVGESYERAYADMLRVQQLTELEEILAVKWEEEEEAGGRPSSASGLAAAAAVPPAVLLAGGLGGAGRGRALTQQMWNGRLRGVQRNVEVWQALLRCACVGAGAGNGAGAGGRERSGACSTMRAPGHLPAAPRHPPLVQLPPACCPAPSRPSPPPTACGA